MKPGLKALVALALAVLFTVAGAAGLRAAPTFPALSGRVVDDAHVLPAAEVADLTAKLQALEMKTSRQLVVVTLPSLQGYEIEEYGYQLGRAWGLGQKGLNNGALLIVAPAEHKVRIEVGYGLEGVLTDALSSVMLQTQVLPRFRMGDIPGGVSAGTDAIIEQLSLDTSTAEQRAAQAQAQAQAAASTRESGRPSPFAFIFLAFFVFMMFRSLFSRGGGGLWALPFIFGAGGGGRYNDGGGFGGGGGFSGGGGSFGGGGSSGSW